MGAALEIGNQGGASASELIASVDDETARQSPARRASRPSPRESSRAAGACPITVSGVDFGRPPANAGETYRVVLELENVGTESRSIPLDDPLAFTWEVTCDGTNVPTSLGRTEISSRIGWTKLTPGARVEIEASAETRCVERGYSLDLVTRIWPALPCGRLHLHGTYHGDLRRQSDVPKDARTLTLLLPSCRLAGAPVP
jgi:hypothetical protein